MVFLVAGFRYQFWGWSQGSPSSRLCSPFAMEHTRIASELLHILKEEDKKPTLSERTSWQWSKNTNILPRVIWSDIQIGQCCPALEFTAREAPRVEQGWNMSLSQYKTAECAAEDFYKSPNPPVPKFWQQTFSITFYISPSWPLKSCHPTPSYLLFFFLHGNKRDEQGKPELTFFGSPLPLATSH